MIYLLNGEPSPKRNELAELLVNFLKTERKNWRRDVFYINESNISKLNLNSPQDRIIYTLSYFLDMNQNDVVISNPIGDINYIDSLKVNLNLTEIQLYTDKVDAVDNVIYVNVSRENIKTTFTKLIHELRNNYIV
jgi:hypothetical protein